MNLRKITDWVPNVLEITSIEVLFWFKKLLTDERPHHPTLSMESIWKVNFYPYFFQGCLFWRVLHSAAQHWWRKSELFLVEVPPEEPFRWWPMGSRFISPSRVYQYKNWYSWKRSIINVLIEYQLINLRRVSVWNSSQLLSVPYESEVLLPICYQIRNKNVWI